MNGHTGPWMTYDTAPVIYQTNNYEEYDHES